MHKPQFVFKKLLLFISSILFVLVLAEVAKRSYDKIIHNYGFFENIYKAGPAANFTYRHYLRPQAAVNIKINSLGFRDDELSDKKENEFRIVILGDSITEAFILYKEEVYVEQLEKLLNHQNRRLKFQVINTGLIDSSLVQQIEILQDSGLKTQPDLVGIGFYLNDSLEPWRCYVERGYKYPLLTNSRFLSWLYRRIFIERYIRSVGKHQFCWVKTLEERKWVHNKEIFNRLIKEAWADWGAAWLDSSWEIIGKGLDEVLSLGKEHNFKVFLFCFPVNIQVESEFFDNKPQQTLKQICGARNIPYLDLLPVLRSNNDKDLFYDQCHLKPIGNQIVAQALYQFLQDTSLLPTQ
jgi:lysophospholipase L1-like esterase